MRKHFGIILAILLSSTSLLAEQGFTTKTLMSAPQQSSFDNYVSYLVNAYSKRFKVPASSITILRQELDGRSLEAPHDSLKLPRVSYMLKINKDSKSRRIGSNFIPLMLGYTPSSGKVEIIEWNNGSYKASGLKNVFPGHAIKKDQIIEKQCLSCHQNKMAPIFSRFPWADTKFNSEVRLKMEAARKELKKENPKLHDFSVATNTFDKDQIAYDLNTRMANKGVSIATACKSICENNLNCKKDLFTLSVFGHSPKVKNRLLSTIENRWPMHGYAYPSSVIASYDPLTKQTRIFTNSRVLRTKDSVLMTKSDFNQFADDQYFINFLEFSVRGQIVRTDEEFSEDIPGISNHILENGELFLNPGNPVNPRPLVGKMTAEEFSDTLPMYGASYCLGELDQRSIKSLENERIQEYIYYSEEADQLFRSTPLDQILTKLDQSFGMFESRVPIANSRKSKKNLNLTDKTKLFSKLLPNKEKNNTPSIYSDESMKVLFMTYCGSCHFTGSSNPLPLPLDNPKNLVSYQAKSPHNRIQNGSVVLEKLRNREMPAPNSELAKALSEEERQAMIEYLEKQMKDRQ